MSKQEDILRQAIQAARERGIVITRGATFDWTQPGPQGIPVRAEVASSCDATGAVVLFMGWPGLSPGWLQAVCEFMDVDAFWFWRFWLGWNRNYQVQVWVDDAKLPGKGRWIDDEVCHFARRLARELLRTV